jgi:hypothetical protein
MTPERLRIQHLLLWTAMSAVALSTAPMSDPVFPEYFTKLGRISAAVQSPIFGLGFSAWVLMIWRSAARRFRSEPQFPTQPGHWLLLLVGIAGFAWVLLNKLLSGQLVWFEYSQIACGILNLAMIILAAWFTPQPWRSVFWIALVRGLLQVWALILIALIFALGEQFYFGLSLMMQILEWGFALSLIIAAVIDWRWKTHRDYLHWCGLVALLATILYSFAAWWILAWLQTIPDAELQYRF